MAIRRAVCQQCDSQTVRLQVRAPDLEYACKPGEFELVCCAACGHVFADPMPEPDQIADLYPPTYYTVNPDSPLYLRGFVYRGKIRRDVNRLFKWFKKRQPNAVLDIGCGDGARLLEIARRSAQRIDITGMDLMFDQTVRDRGAEAGMHLIEGNVEADLESLEAERYDFVIMSQLVEHLRQPRATIQRLASRLAPRARVLIETPQFGGGLDYRLFKGRDWGGYHIPRHLHLFSQQSLAQMVRDCGFRIVEQGGLPSPGFWIISLRNRLGLSSARRSRSCFEFLHFANLFVVGALTALDLLRLAFGADTSNQYLLAEKI